MVHTELFQVKQIRRDVNFKFSMKNTVNLQQNSLIPGVRNQQQNRLDYRKHFLGGEGYI